MKVEPVKPLSVRLPVSAVDEYSRRAIRRGVSLHEELKTALLQHLALVPAPQPRAARPRRPTDKSTI